MCPSSSILPCEKQHAFDLWASTNNPKENLKKFHVGSMMGWVSKIHIHVQNSISLYINQTEWWLFYGKNKIEKKNKLANTWNI